MHPPTPNLSFAAGIEGEDECGAASGVGGVVGGVAGGGMYTHYIYIYMYIYAYVYICIDYIHTHTYPPTLIHPPIHARAHFLSQTVYNTKGTRAHTHRELIRKWLWSFTGGGGGEGESGATGAAGGGVVGGGATKGAKKAAKKKGGEYDAEGLVKTLKPKVRFIYTSKITDICFIIVCT